MPSSSKVCFFFQGVSITLVNRVKLKKFIETIFKKEAKPLESLNFIFCSDKALLEINRQYLQHDYYTDIITFDLSDSAHTRGDIYISTDRVRDNARQLNVFLTEELHRVIFHGVLHLCGYKDKKPADNKKMRQMENLYLQKWSRYKA